MKLWLIMGVYLILGMIIGFAIDDLTLKRATGFYLHDIVIGKHLI